MKTYKSLLILFAASWFGFISSTYGGPNKGQPFPKTQSLQEKRLSGGCAISKAQTDLNVNDVRARIFSCGDMWWDLVGLAKYEVPKVIEAGGVSRTSLFAGSLWIGGFESNNLKIAAMTYRQSGVDFFSGPLDTITANTDPASCNSWDNLYQVTSAEIQAFKLDNTQITNDIATWPGNGNGYNGSQNFSRSMAPFVDLNHDGRYDPSNGDYPDVPGDQALWYVYNDKGAAHGETKGDPIGLECQETAFAFSTNDELNDMTFYKTVVINRSRNTLDSTWFGQWVDPDLGYAFDDYVGCDTSRNLGYDYNGEDVDPGVTGYGKNPPAVGVGFFHGPVNPKTGKEIGMSKFLYYNNDFGNPNSNPSAPLDYYHYLEGYWRNGQVMRYGKDGVSGSVPTSYMFTGDPAANTGWTEKSAGDKPGDRRFLESSGPFQLTPGAKNTVTVAVVWARTNSGGATGSLNQLKLATDLAKITYNNNFNILYGADAPDVTIRELDKKLVLSLQNTNTPTVEHYTQDWVDKNNNKIHYAFQGYLVYQLANSSVSRADYNDPTKAQLIAQCDLKDSIKGAIYNFGPAAGVQGQVNVLQLATQPNNGLFHTLEVTQDLFASGDQTLVNYKTYYFSVVSYSTVVPSTLPDYEANFVGSKHNVQTLIASPHKNDAEFSGTQLNSDYGGGPDITRIEGDGNGGNVLEFTQATVDQILSTGKVANPTYQGGFAPVNVKVYDPTLIKAGSYDLKITDSTIAATGVADGRILAENPITTGTLHPKLISSAKWIVDNFTTGDVIKSENDITVNDEQILFTQSNSTTTYLGMSVQINQVFGPGGSDNTIPNDITNGFLEATMTFADSSHRWLTGVVNLDFAVGTKGVPNPENWIRVGKADSAAPYNPVTDAAAYQTKNFITIDPFGAYGQLLGGIIAPAAVVARDGSGPGNSLTLGDIPKNVDFGSIRISNLNSVDLVFTPDQTKWSDCIVIEMGESAGLNEGGAAKFSLRKHASWNGQIDANGNPIYDNSSMGKSKFPGYAVNLETGERLNVFFSEDSHFPEFNGADMLWNPTSDQTNDAAGFTDYVSHYIYGGKHWIYVMNSVAYAKPTTLYPAPIPGYTSAYDGCQTYYNVLNGNPASSDIKSLWSACIWVMEPLLNLNNSLASLKDGIIPNETKIRLRVAKPYTTYNTSSTPQNQNKPYYKFATDGITPTRTEAVGKNALQEVGITPNPYYAGSAYETSQLDNRVKFVNVPTKCEITIYTIDGVLVRKFTKDDTKNNAYTVGGPYPAVYLDWDLNNQQGIQVASGVYLIHVNGFELGEKIIKWFGVMKPLDLDTF